MNIRSICILLGFIIAGCSSQLAMVHKEKYDTSVALDEVRIELSDLKHNLNSTQVELQILDEKIKSQDVSLQKARQGTTSGVSTLDYKISSMEKKLSHLEKMQEKIASELKLLSSYQSRISELEDQIAAQNKYLEEFSELKSTLSSISKAIKQPPAAAPYTHTYQVKSGDSLEKIAKANHTTVEALKKINGLTSHKIMIGQQLQIPHE